MKKSKYIIILSALMLTLLSACGKNINGTAIELNEIINSQSESAIISVSNEITKASGYVKKTSIELFFQKIREDDSVASFFGDISEKDLKDSYIGEYNSYDVDEPDLEIEKKPNGTYRIQIDMYRLASLDECVGVKTRKGIFFSTTEMYRDVRGIITLEDDIATVTFITSDWAEFSEIMEFQYYKVSDIPNIDEWSWGGYE